MYLAPVLAQDLKFIEMSPIERGVVWAESFPHLDLNSDKGQFFSCLQGSTLLSKPFHRLRELQARVHSNSIDFMLARVLPSLGPY